MTSRCTHTIHSRDSHIGWNNANTPALAVAPGETVEFETIDSSGAQLSAKSTLAAMAKLAFGKVNPVPGPVHVDGAVPGAAIKVTPPGLTPSARGWVSSDRRGG